MHLILSRTFIVGQLPLPLSNALHAASKDSKASFLPRLGILPKKVGEYFSVDEIVEYISEYSPCHLINSPSDK